MSANASTLNFPKPLTTVDVVIFSIQSESLHVLLIKRNHAADEPYPGQWSLVGGFVNVDQDFDLKATAVRKLKDKTNVDSPYLEQLGSWGSNSRDPRGWSATHVYFALIYSNMLLNHGGNAEAAKWVKVNGNGVDLDLAFDHKEILETAIVRLRNKVEYTSLPAYLMPDTFTMSELQHIYEIVLERKLEKSAFRTRVLATDLVVPTADYKLGSNRPAQLYQIKDRTAPVFFLRTFKPADE